MENSKSLGWDCLDQVVRLQKQGGDDIRLNIKLFKYCLNDQKKFCKDVEPGHMRVQVGSLKMCSLRQWNVMVAGDKSSRDASMDSI
jgi:hypothetical protein